MDDIIVKLSERNMERYFFGFQIGQRVTSREGEFEGTLKDATYFGSDGGGACNVTCDVLLDDGQVRRTALANLDRV